ncbi:alpha-glucosidase [Sulfolobus sp. A20]|uniref:alpha-glucosidase MalA n=1 Tax=Sulfolobaceae TaxID=118883 RepID=UPI000845D592|nr:MULTISPECIES: alpha-glucosidase MalA [unclassified Sulfolobus]TRM78822.1 glycoside hydrolase family 31 protein [Sulfolobus sp. B5]TRM87156.1 glycoside hydrolase family 31 protein [Sulfolobus sp. C3]TRM88093.1 glycoside hydrolase family 31 protein [Sulfolobus sp. E3]TRN03456.1 glycoside hydrolase family 31 protein [Sulfolobus sp. F1]TRN03613.1 glycoside hydrolase family 31 protein [Sulfolobus sp. E1]
MRIEAYEKSGIFRLMINDPIPPIDFGFRGSKIEIKDFPLEIKEEGNHLLITKPLGLKEHILGLGEKAFELDRKRKRYFMYNVDAGAYKKYDDPLYVNIPFFISVNDGIAKGYFINYAGRLIVDVGFKEYNKIIIEVPERSVEIFVFEGPTIEKVIEKYTDLTGKPYLLPYWALGYMISRYSYFPQDSVIELVDLMQKEGFRITGVFLDIHFMDSYKLFTWHRERFPDPKKMIEELKKRNVKLITIVDHGIRVDQNYNVFISGIGNYCELDNGSMFVGKLWPGYTVYPDFFREKTREWWANLISEWLSQGVDGIWLDMNEPTDFTKIMEINNVLKDLPIKVKDDRLYYTFPDNVVHDGKFYHWQVRNAYPYYEAMATFEGFRKAGRSEVFILSRAGYAGIQRYASIWTGDNTPSWDDLRLQLKLVLGLSISGVPYVGIDIGGFQGRGFYEIENSPELLMRYYQLALFFPFYRSHKATDGIDSEPLNLPSFYKEKVKEAINIRYKFLPYLYYLVKESNLYGHPIVRPLFYEFQDDESCYYIDDEYMVGKFLLYAPIVYPNQEKRRVYLPNAKWFDYWSNEILEGKSWVYSSYDLPIYIKEGSIILLEDNELLVFGNGEIRYDDIVIKSEEKRISFSNKFYVKRLYWIERDDIKKVIVNKEKDKSFERKNNLFIIHIGEEVKDIHLI